VGPTGPLASIENRMSPNPMNHAPHPSYKYSLKFFTLFHFPLSHKKFPTATITLLPSPQTSSPPAEHDRQRNDGETRNYQKSMVRCFSLGSVLILIALAASMVVLPLMLPPLPPPPLALLFFPVGIMAALVVLAFSPSENVKNVVVYSSSSSGISNSKRWNRWICELWYIFSFSNVPIGFWFNFNFNDFFCLLRCWYYYYYYERKL